MTSVKASGATGVEDGMDASSRSTERPPRYASPRPSGHSPLAPNGQGKVTPAHSIEHRILLTATCACWRSAR